MVERGQDRSCLAYNDDYKVYLPRKRREIEGSFREEAIPLRAHKAPFNVRGQVAWADYSLISPPEIRLLAGESWRDGTPLHAGPTANICGFLGTSPDTVINRIHYWFGISFDTQDVGRWRRIWAPNIAVKESCLQWQIIFKSNASNAWRFFYANPTEEIMWCPMCPLHRTENNKHLLWECPAAGEIWNWILYIFTLRDRSESAWLPTIVHAVLGDKLPGRHAPLQKWWDCIRITTLWYILTCKDGKAFHPLQPIQSKMSNAILIWGNICGHIF